MTTRVGEVIHEWLGWCPKQTTFPGRPERNNNVIYLLVIGCLLAVSVTALVMAAGSSHNDAVWIFSRDDSGTAHFVKRVEVPVSVIKSQLSAEDISAEVPPGGRYFILIQHPRADGTFDVVLNGDYIMNQLMNAPGSTGSTILFRIGGPGSLQGDDAFEALIYAIDDPQTYFSGNTGEA